MSEDNASQPWSHLHVAISHLNKPASDIEKAEGLGFGYDSDKMKTEVNGSAKKAMEQEELETLTFLNESERLDTSIEKVLATASGDIIGLAYRADFMRSSVAVKGRGRDSVKVIVAGQAPKISVPTTLGKVRRIISNRGKEESREEEWSQASG